MCAPEQTLCSRIAAAVRDIARKRQKSHSLTATIVPNCHVDDNTRRFRDLIVIMYKFFQLS